MFESIDRLIEFGVQISVIIGLIGALAAWLKRSINRDMVSQVVHDAAIAKVKEEYEEYADKAIAAHKELTEKNDEADKIWLNKLQDKVEKLQIKVGE